MALGFAFKFSPQPRFLFEMEKVIYDHKWAKMSPKHMVLYLMFRGLKEEGDIRFDITVIFPQMLGKELPRTKGHYHLHGATEVYQVLQGKSLFFFQKVRKKEAKDIYIVEAKKGDYILIPPGYEHITINLGKTNLVLANWIKKQTKSVYSRLEKMGGPSYFLTTEGWKKNKRYLKLAKIRKEKPLKKKPNLYSCLK